MGKRLMKVLVLVVCGLVFFFKGGNSKAQKSKEREGRRRSKILICCNISQYKKHTDNQATR